eukprot:1128589-Prorocentrum_lima.AAC.1
MFQKPPLKLLTYGEIGTGFDAPYTRGRYDTLDWMLIGARWRNSVKDVEAHFEAGIDTLHRPLTA